MAQVGLFNVGTSPLGSGVPDHPEGTSYYSTGAFTLPDGTGTAGSGASDLSGPDFSGMVEQYMYDANTGSPIYLAIPLTGGSITEDIESMPFATGTIESDGLPQGQYLLFVGTGGTGIVGSTLQLVTKTRLGSNESNVERSANMGRYTLEELQRRADPGKFGATFRVASEALSNLGDTVSGDLTGGDALAFSATLGLLADGRASIEGIAAWIIERSGNAALLSDDFLALHPPTPAFQLLVDGVAVGPYSIGTRAAGDVLRQAIDEAGIYLRCRMDGSVVLTPWPGAAATPPSMTVVRSYGYGTDDHPFVYVQPAPIAKPSSVSIIQQSAIFATRTVTVSVADGQGTGVPRYYNHFRPVASDPDDHQTRRAQQLGAAWTMRGEQVEIGVLSDGVVHAGDSILIDASSHGITRGIFLVARAVHPLGPGNYVANLTCRRLAYTWT